MTDQYKLIQEFTTPIMDTGNGEYNRWEGYITQGLPHPDFIDNDGNEGWHNKLVHDSHKIYLTLYWVDEYNGITNEKQVTELTGLAGFADLNNVTWPLVINHTKGG